jgi:hypothetical protein
MTYTEALAVFGLTRIMDAAVMKVFYHDAARKARDAGDEEREKIIHKAWAVLTGKEDATLLDQPKEKVEGASGTARALCTHERGKAFVMDWKQVPRGAGDKRDLLIYSNPQTITWDGDVDGYVRVSVKGEKAPYDPAAALRKANHDPMDGTQPGHANTATHSGKVDVEQAPCPICAAPRLMVCNTCLTIICHRFRNDYPEQGFNCPKCNAVYQWGTGRERGDVIIDGKQLRSLTKDERKEITEDMVKGRITYLGAKD